MKFTYLVHLATNFQLRETLIVCADALHPSQQCFPSCRDNCMFSWVEPDEVSCPRTQNSEI